MTKKQKQRRYRYFGIWYGPNDIEELVELMDENGCLTPFKTWLNSAIEPYELWKAVKKYGEEPVAKDLTIEYREDMLNAIAAGVYDHLFENIEVL